MLRMQFVEEDEYSVRVVTRVDELFLSYCFDIGIQQNAGEGRGKPLIEGSERPLPTVCKLCNIVHSAQQRAGPQVMFRCDLRSSQARVSSLGQCSALFVSGRFHVEHDPGRRFSHNVGLTLV